MTKGKNNVIKAGFWYTFSNFLVRGIAFLTMPIFTRIMSSYDIGVFSNILAWFNILAIVTTFEIYSSINIARFDYKDDLDSYISSSLILSTLITSVFYVVALIFHNFFEKLLLIDFQTLNIIFIYLLVFPAFQMFQTKNQIQYNYKPTTIVSILSSVLSTICAIACIFIFSNKLVGRIYGYFVPLIIICFILYIHLIFKGNKSSKKYWKYALKISFPLIWHLLAGYLLNASDRIMITKIVSPEANALYTISYSVASVVSILWLSLNNAWSPWAYEKMDRKDYSSLKSYSKPYTILFMLVVFGIMLFGPELLFIMGGKEYSTAIFVLPPVMVGFIFQFVYSLYVNIEFYHKKQKNIAIGTIIACIANIILNLIFIPIFGYIAAAYTTLVGYVLLFLIHYYLVKRLKCTHWYDKSFFFKVLSLSILSIGIFDLLYIFDIIRYIFILIIFVCFVIFIAMRRKQLIEVIKTKNIHNLLKIFMKEND